MGAPSFDILAMAARLARKSAFRETRLQFEHLEDRRLLTLVSSTNGNMDAASLQAALSPDPALPFFGNVGRSSTGNASVTYLGNGWVLTAGHNPIANVITGSPGGVTFGNNHFNVDESSITYLHNMDNSLADLKVFKMIGDPGLPSMFPVLDQTSTAFGRQIMIGNGRSLDLANQRYWNVNTSDMNNYVWTSESQPAMPGPNDFSGFNIPDGQVIRWGENDVVPDPNNPQQAFEQTVHTADDSQNHPLIIRGYFTQFDNSTYTGVTPRPYEAQGSSGDSGGPVFSLINGQWELSGIMIQIFLFDNQSLTTAVFGDATFIADLTQYSTEILRVTTSTVAARNLFYAGSTRYDATGNPQTPLPFSDDNAIATDKTAYLPGSGAATFANVSSYDRGINGIMVDLSGGGSHTSITQANILDDFTFKVGNNNAPSTWTAAPNPTTVTVRAGAGVSGSDRVELIWADGAIKEEWLEVTIKATADTDLTANDVFFFGNAVANSGGGDTATLSETNSVDELGARNNGKTLLNNIPITNLFDYNRDGLVNSVDSLLSRNNSQTLGATRYINVPVGGPFAPPPSGDNVANSGAAPAASSSQDAVASALANKSTTTSTQLPIGAWIVNQLTHLDLNQGPIARYFEHLANEDTSRSQSLLVKADRIADTLNRDDAWLDSLVVNLGLE
jgi:hypothetical protein